MHYIELAIGDDSGDGHEKRDTFIYASNKPRNEVQRAYWNAVNVLPGCDPAAFCDEFEQRAIPQPYLDNLKKEGAPLHDPTWVCASDFVEIVAWFIKKGDDELQFEPLDVESIQDSRRGERGVPTLGYGLYSC